MAQSLSSIFVHVIFSTKIREPFLQDPVLRGEMHAYLAGALNDVDCPALLVGGPADHTHVLCDLSRNMAVAKVVGEIKRSSSLWAKTRDSSLNGFYWQNGYGVFSVSYSNIGRVKRYILDQENYHLVRSFQDEFRQFLRRHAVEYDERYGVGLRRYASLSGKPVLGLPYPRVALGDSRDPGL